MEMSVDASGYPSSVLTLSLVSERNVPLAVILVSAPLPPPLLPFPHHSKGHIYYGRIRYASSQSTRETVTHLPPHTTAASISMLYLPRDERYR